MYATCIVSAHVRRALKIIQRFSEPRNSRDQYPVMFPPLNFCISYFFVVAVLLLGVWKFAFGTTNEKGRRNNAPETTPAVLRRESSTTTNEAF